METISRTSFLFAISLSAPALAATGDEVDFNEHIQPILSEYCYHCHGPDAGTRTPKSEPLRLDIEEDAFLPREETGKPVIIKGDPEASLLIQRILTDDPDDIMPPPKAHKVMKPDEIEMLKQWIEQGAPYEGHWSFEPITRPELPESAGSWSDHPLDRFAEAKLKENGLKPNSDEEAARLYRRLHLDLTGLPPGPEDLAAFAKAADADLAAAVANEADRLLATTVSAEHFARHWLDAARYADTHGIHIDNYRAIWPYRDWVVRAFEQNMPWDQFTTEQIAGDLLPKPTLDQKVATGFHRCLPTTGEGGAIAEEYLAIYAQDRVDTTSGVWLGLTMGCASCHDHKFDPVTMKDNYSMSAFFRNTPMSALDRNNAEHPPNIFVPVLEDRERHPVVVEEITTLDDALAQRRNAAKTDFEKWIENPTLEDPRDADSSLAFHLPLNEASGASKGLSEGASHEWSLDTERIDGPLGKAPIISNNPVVLGDHASFARDDQVTFGGYVYFEGKPNGAIISRMNPEQGLKGWDLSLEGDKPVVHIVDTWPDAANKLRRGRGLAAGKWHHIMVTFDGRQSGHQSLSLFVDGQRASMRPAPNSVGGDIVAEAPLVLGARAGDDSKLTGGKVALQDFRLYQRLLNPDEIRLLSSFGKIAKTLATPRDQWGEDETKMVFEYFLEYIDEPMGKLLAKKEPLARELSEIKERGSASLIMQEKDEEPFAHMLIRGVYSDKGERVTPATPASLPPMPADAPRNRLGLAQWLMAPENPLTARVTMNRLWQKFFGTGIVETAGDFGIMGARPTHPKLLDWLASEFRDSGWDHRHMTKLIVTSRTYRQSAQVSAEKLEADPDNRLLSRGPRYRLDAEQIRDLALAGSGLLSQKVGGPPVKPYQPEGIWSAVAMPQSNTRNYQRDTGEGLYRRSLYTFWKRTAPHPAMEILNAPTREVFCVTRERTNTPLQAFVTLNDPQFVESSRHLAEQAVTRSAGFDERIDFITLRLLSRTLTVGERQLVQDTLAAAMDSFKDDPAAAASVINSGETKPSSEAIPAELAAWTIVASQIFNLDESLNK